MLQQQMTDTLVMENLRCVNDVLEKFSIPDSIGEDAYAAGVLGLVKAANNFNGERDFPKYAQKIIEDEIASFLESEKKHCLSYELEEENDAVYRASISQSAEVDERITSELCCSELLEWILQLKSKERQVVFYNLSGMTIQQIATRMRISQVMAVNYFKQAQKNLKVIADKYEIAKKVLRVYVQDGTYELGICCQDSDSYKSLQEIKRAVQVELSNAKLVENRDYQVRIDDDGQVIVKMLNKKRIFRYLATI